MHQEHCDGATLEPAAVGATEGDAVVGVILTEERLCSAELLQWALQSLDARASAELEVVVLCQYVLLPQPTEVLNIIK